MTGRQSATKGGRLRLSPLRRTGRLRQAFRNFRLDRIQALEVSATSFTPRPETLQDYWTALAVIAVLGPLLTLLPTLLLTRKYLKV